MKYFREILLVVCVCFLGYFFVLAVRSSVDWDRDGYPPRKGQDCDDGNKAVYPGAREVCDGRDNDCDGEADEGVGTTWYRDADGDGYATATSTTRACSEPAGYLPKWSDTTLYNLPHFLLGDCDDTKASVNPGAAEICDGKDNNCNGQIDEGVKKTFYPDADGDGYGKVRGVPVEACKPPAGYAVGGDCNDANVAINPGAAEICNGKDDNCNGQADEGLVTVWFRDQDGDGYGRSGSATVRTCRYKKGWSVRTGDCDDGNPIVHPVLMDIGDCRAQSDESPVSPQKCGPTFFSNVTTCYIWKDRPIWACSVIDFSLPFCEER